MANNHRATSYVVFDSPLMPPICPSVYPCDWAVLRKADAIYRVPTGHKGYVGTASMPSATDMHGKANNTPQLILETRSVCQEA